LIFEIKTEGRFTIGNRPSVFYLEIKPIDLVYSSAAETMTPT